MFGFLGFIFIILFVIILFAFALIGNLLHMIWGFFGKSTPKRSKQHASSDRKAQTSAKESYSGMTNNKKKIFSDDEGEYVEFEEIN